MRAIATFLLTCWIGGQVPAQEVTPLTLDEAIARSLAHSARLAEADARRAGAASAEAGRAAAARPVVSALGGYTRTNHVDEFFLTAPGQPSRVLYPDVPDNYRARIDLQWPIYTAGRAAALERAAAAEGRAVGEEHAAIRADLVLEATRAFWALVTARETERVLTRSLERFDAHLRDLRARLEQGLISPHEVLSAVAQRSRQRLLSIEAAANRARTEADLRRLTGAAGAVEPVETTAPAIDVSALRGAPDQRPERRALEHRLDAARDRVDAVSAAARPQVAVNGGYDLARPNPRIFPRADRWDPSWDATFSVTWTLWDAGRRSAERGEAAAAALALAARLDEVDRQTAFEVQWRALDVESARAGIDTAADGVRAATEARRVIDERYQAGVASSTDVVDAEIAVLQAELDRTRATAALRIAEAALRRAAGRER